MVKYIVLILLFNVSHSVFSENISSVTHEDFTEAKNGEIKDPTVPIGYQVKKNVLLKSSRPALPILQSVFIANKKHQAIISNKFYSVGQIVNGYKITRIQQKSVRLMYQSKTYTINLYSNSQLFIE